MTDHAGHWFVGSNGTNFFDWGGWRYGVARVDGRWEVRRNGEPWSTSITNSFVSLPEAKDFVETNSGWCGRACEPTKW